MSLRFQSFRAERLEACNYGKVLFQNNISSLWTLKAESGHGLCHDLPSSRGTSGIMVSHVSGPFPEFRIGVQIICGPAQP